MKKEEITVKLTINNRQKVLKTLRKTEQNYRVSYKMSVLKNNILVYEKIYLFYSADSNLWITSSVKPKDKTLIKPKQLKELLENEPPYTSKYWDNPLWEGNPLYEVVKDDKGNKGEKDNPIWQEPHKTFNPIGVEGTWTIKGDEIISDPKTLEVGKWYKRPNFSDGRFMFMFMGEFGNEKSIGFDPFGEYCDGLGVHEHKIPEYTEAKPEEVIEAFVYHMETFAK